MGTRAVLVGVVCCLAAGPGQVVEAGSARLQGRPSRPAPGPGRRGAAAAKAAAAVAPAEIAAGPEGPGRPSSGVDRDAGEARPVVSGRVTLAEVEALALRESPVIRGAAAEIEAAAARLRMAQAMRRPGLSANTFASAGDAPNILYTVEPVVPRMFMTVPSGFFLNQNVMAMLPLYTGGRLRALVDRAGALRNASRAELETTRQEVALMARVAYHEAAARRSLIEVAEAALRATEERLRRAQLLAEEGRVPLVNVRREEAELASARQQLTNAQRDLEIALIQLSTVVGVGPESRLEPAASLEPQALEEDGLPGELSELQALAVEQRPELRAANQRVRSERLGVAAARGLSRPQVAGMGMADLGASSGNGLDPNVTVGAVASLPILDGGLRRAQVSEAEALRRRGVEERRRVTLQVGQEVATAFANLQAAAQNVGTAQAGVTAAEEDYRLALARFEAGRSPMTDVLDAQAALTRARTNRVQALFDERIARDRLRRAVGEPVGEAAETKQEIGPGAP